MGFVQIKTVTIAFTWRLPTFTSAFHVLSTPNRRLDGRDTVTATSEETYFGEVAAQVIMNAMLGIQ